jgi:hypothetical protein
MLLRYTGSGWRMCSFRTPSVHRRVLLAPMVDCSEYPVSKWSFEAAALPQWMGRLLHSSRSVSRVRQPILFPIFGISQSIAPDSCCILRLPAEVFQRRPQEHGVFVLPLLPSASSAPRARRLSLPSSLEMLSAQHGFGPFSWWVEYLWRACGPVLDEEE